VLFLDQASVGFLILDLVFWAEGCKRQNANPRRGKLVSRSKTQTKTRWHLIPSILSCHM